MALSNRFADAWRLSAFVAALLLVVPASAGELALDSLSFIHFPGSQFTAQLPAGFSLPIAITEKREGVWNLRVDASAIPGYATTAPDGSTVGIALNPDSGGECVETGGALSCRLLMVVVVVGRKSPKPMYVPVSLTTEMAGKSSAVTTAAREGARLDAASGFLQLAGVGEAPAEWGPLSGEPFYVVLSGVLSGLPAAMAEGE